MSGEFTMKNFVSKLGIAKILCGLLLVLSLSLLVLLLMENNNTGGTPVNESEEVKAEYREKAKAKYREKVEFSRDTWIEFPDFDLLYLGTGVSTGGGMHVPIKSYYFRIVKGSEENIIFWTAGTGVIEPVPFEFNDNGYTIEMKRMSLGREGEDKLGKNELSISRTD
jgi:uncharacterized membrane protein YraQ (UPF0718 family)